jgi:hypothetical protein
VLIMPGPKHWRRVKEETVKRLSAPVVADHVSNENDAAFRDELFLGRLDAEGGRKPHLTSGRWSADVDRRLFVSGYLKAYGEMYSRAASEHTRGLGGWQGGKAIATA